MRTSREEMLGQIAAMEAHRLVGIVAVIVVPIEQRARRLRTPAAARACRSRRKYPLRRRWTAGCCSSCSSPCRAPRRRFSSSDVQHCTALISTSAARIHCSTTAPSFAILISASVGTPAVETYLLDRLQFLPTASSESFIRPMRPITSERSNVSTEMPLRFEKFLAVAHGIERRRPRADRADAQTAQALHDAADGREPFQILAKFRGIGPLGVQRRQRVRNAVLRQVVAGRHLAAKAVAAVRDGHLRRRIRRGLHQHGHAQIRKPQRIRDPRARRRNSAASRSRRRCAPCCCETTPRSASPPRAFPPRRTCSAPGSARRPQFPAVSSALQISSRPVFAR